MNTTDAREFLLDIAADDCYCDEMLRICFHDDNCIDKKSLLSFLRKQTSATGIPQADKDFVCSYIEEINNDDWEYIVFLRLLKIRLIDTLFASAGYTHKVDYYDSLSPLTFWAYSVIAMKKCLGRGKSQVVISDTNLYYSLIPMQINQAQKDSHDNCIKIFSRDADEYSVHEHEELRLYLHPFRSKNQKLKTQKKNLSRVVKRVKRIMQINKLSHNKLQGNMFSDGRYVVPEQFAECIKKLFLNQ